MNFAEPVAWKLLLESLLCVLIVRFIIARFFPARIGSYDKIALAAISATLLWSVDSTTFVIFFAVTLITYAGLWTIGRLKPSRPERFIWIMAPVQLAPLLFFKYSNFLFNETIHADFELIRDLAIPAGISFYSFQLVSFVVDTLVHRKPMPQFLDFLNFAGFFPQIVAGPIERRDELFPQIQRFRFSWDPARIDAGVRWIVIGVFFKACLADNLALYFDPTHYPNAYFVWLANLIFGCRIYLDFAGYSYIALGLAKCFGIELTLNFASPYCSRNIGDFWRRWHITLSQWFRDYAYVPLGGNRVQRWQMNVMIVFLVSGIWHGAGWNFVLWGMLHGFYLIALRIFSKRSLPLVASWAITMFAVFFSWLYFYETNTSVLMAKTEMLLMPQSYGPDELGEFIQFLKNPDAFVMSCFLALTGVVIAAEMVSLKAAKRPLHCLNRLPSLIAMVVLIVWLAPGTKNSFIYFSF